MEAMVVPRVGFPGGRVTRCCGRKTRSGDSVIVIAMPTVFIDRRIVHAILHKRCLADLLTTMPADASDYVANFDDLKANMALQSTAFPNKKQAPRGPLAPRIQKPPKRKLRSVG